MEGELPATPEAEGALGTPPARDRDVVRSAQGSSPEDDMPLTQPTGNSPVTGSARLNFELRLREVAASDSRPDPVSTLADRLHGVTTLEELSAILEPADLFTNCQDSQALHRTISCILTQIVEENQADVGEVGQDPRFELRLLLPSPMFHAVRTVAKHQGWSAEALCQGLMANVGWLHSEGARIRMSPQEMHQRTTCIPAFFGAPPSARKSSLHQFLTSELLGGDAIPAHAQASQSFCGTGTLRGHRNNLFNFGRTGLSSSEVTETYKTKSESDGVPASQFAQKNHINKWCHSEADRSITGNLRDNNIVYSFYHLVHGQVPATVEVLTGGTAADIGFVKRFNVVFTTHMPQDSPEQSTQASSKLLHDLMAWLAARMPQTASTEIDIITLSPFARQWVRVVLEAVRDFLDQHGDISAAWTQKLMYADTDILRWANCVNKMRGFLASMSQLDPNQVAASVDIIDVQYALHSWIRQLEFFAALQRHTKSFRSSHGSMHVGELRTPAGPQEDGQEEQEVMLMKWIITATSDTSDTVVTKDLRKILKNKLSRLGGWKRTKKQQGEESRPANPEQDTKTERKHHVQLLLSATKRLKQAGLIQWATDEAQPKAGVGGHEVLTFRKRPWSEIVGNDEATGWVRKLKIGMENFPCVDA